MKVTFPLGRSVGLLFTALTLTAIAQNNPEIPTSDNDKMLVLPAPGAVVIDGKDSDWDLSAGMWSYNDPTLVEKHSTWTHLMWDDKGVYVLVRYHDPTPMINATRGKDFHMSWQADAMQARLIFDDKTPDEHQMHVNIFYSSSEQQPYKIVHHGGFKKQPPYDATGPAREDQLEKYSSTMEAFGGKVAFSPWEDGKGYNLEAFWPWSYLRTSGQPLKAGDAFTFGLEAMWGGPSGDVALHRLADNLKDDKVNRTFFFRARDGWGKAILSDKGQQGITEAQKQLHAKRLKMFVDYDTVGPIAIPYTLAGEKRDVTIAIDNADGQRVRNLFGQFPREKGENTDYWDGLDDSGKPVPPGDYTATIVDHAPFQLRFVNSVYNAATPPWQTPTGSRYAWGSNHGFPTSAASRGDITLLGFTGTEGTSGIMRVSEEGRILWAEGTESLDITASDKYAYLLSRESWTKRPLIRRLDIEKGSIVLFEDNARSTETVLPIKHSELTNDASIAYAHGKLFAVAPGKNLFVFHPDSGALEATHPLDGLVSVTDRNDTLWGLFEDGTVSQLDASGKKKGLSFASKVSTPNRLGVSHDQQRFAVSSTEGNQVFLFDPQGKKIGTIGEAYALVDGKRPAGRYIETNLIKPLGLDFDAKGRLWIAESEGTSRRVTRWSPENKLEEQYWGSADYGALSGFPLPHDSTRFIAHGVEFQLDPDPDIHNRPTAEKPLIFHPALSKTCGFVYSVKGNEYAVSTPGWNKQEWVTIAKRDKEGVFREVVRLQYGDQKKPGTAWTDRNENGVVDEGEMVEGFEGRRLYWSNGWMRADLTFITPDQKVYRPKEFTKTGVPIYDFTAPETLPNNFKPDTRANRSGTIVMDSAGNVSDGINFATVDGRTGSYPNPYGRHDAPAARRGLLIAPFRTNGVVENVPGVGSITALGGDRGEWFLLSMDGLYLSSILQDSKADVTLDDTYVGQESFGGFIWRDEKDRVMVQLGGPSYRLMEVTGLETTRKTTIPLKATAKQIAEGERAAQARRDASPKEASTLRIARVEKLPTEAPAVDTKETLIPGTPTVRIQEEGNKANWFRVALAHDGTDLAIAYQVNDPHPWKNAEGRFDHAFIGGDAVDLQLQVPGRGEIRLLAAPLENENRLIYWQKRSKEKVNPTTYVVANNEANAQQFDVVKRLASGKVTLQKGPSGYTVLITVPLADLGLEPGTTEMLKGIAGVILSDPSGTNRAQRLYWFDKATGMVSDVPSEARLNSKTWGPITLDK